MPEMVSTIASDALGEVLREVSLKTHYETDR
jgi:hypothetical protein